MENVKFQNNKNFNLLIDEPFNIIYKYIFALKKNCKITLLSNENQEIKKKISSQEKSEINDNIISYLNKNKEEKFNVIILAKTNENHEIGYNYIKKDNLKIDIKELEEDLEENNNINADENEKINKENAILNEDITPNSLDNKIYHIEYHRKTVDNDDEKK